MERPAEGEEPWATKFEFVVDMSNTQKFNNVRGLLGAPLVLTN